jgi:predicted aspartyl protease
MARRHVHGISSLALIVVLRAVASDTPTIAEPDAGSALLAEIKPQSFVYVAPTRRDRIGRVMAPVFVNGVGPFAFLVDTGASTSVVAPRLAARLKLEPTNGRTKLLRGITGSERVPTVPIQSLTAGEIVLSARDLPMVEPRVFADADGIFGADAFAKGCLFVNFGEKRVAILDHACPRVSEHWEVMRAQLRFGGLAVVKARVGNVRVSAIIDTGAERSLGNSALLAATGLQRKIADPNSRTQVAAATSQLVPGNIIRAPPLRMGGIEIANMQIVFGDFEVFEMWDVGEEPAIVVGMDVLGTTSAMMLDFAREEMRILPASRGDSVSMKLRGPATRIP